MHPYHCRIDCAQDECSCTPNKHELIRSAAADLFHASVSALDYLKSRNLDGGQVGANLYNAIAKASGANHEAI